MKKTVTYASVERIEYEFTPNEALEALRAHFKMPEGMEGTCEVLEADFDRDRPAAIYVELHKTKPVEAPDAR